MNKNITSYNQTGGITAENVNLNNQINHNNPKKLNFLKKIGFVITILSLIIAALTYFGIKP